MKAIGMDAMPTRHFGRLGDLETSVNDTRIANSVRQESV